MSLLGSLGRKPVDAGEPGHRPPGTGAPDSRTPAAIDHLCQDLLFMLLGRILATLSLLCALVVAAIGFWRGDGWGIGLGVYLMCSAVFTMVVVWRARR
ncbi:hypothetical protein [Streptomyces sp. NPDC052496]|uniref:hypothetical protein n=1 Tax=Streptomyces sp. NPDC052496 TaxID=3154951 RepID=UPI003440A1B7